MTISIASLSDVDEIRDFIHEEWKKNHILARDRNFFEYEHVVGDRVNFVLARDNGVICGVLGFIPTAKTLVSDVATVIWKVSSTCSNPILGIELLNFLQDQPNVDTVFSVGINSKTIGIYKYLEMFTGKLEQYVLINRSLDRFVIGKFSKSALGESVDPIASEEDFSVRKLTRSDDLGSFPFEQGTNENHTPSKDSVYFTKRYWEHPVYKYSIFGVFRGQKLESVLVTRIQEWKGSKVLRVVDFYGHESALPMFGSFLRCFLEAENLEYADFYSFGLSSAMLQRSGFQLVPLDQEDLVVPNYFSPFLQENIPIHFFAATQNPEVLRLFKGDGDQDRPS